MKCQLTGKDIQVEAIYELLPYQKEINRRLRAFKYIKDKHPEAKFVLGARRYEAVYDRSKI